MKDIQKLSHNQMIVTVFLGTAGNMAYIHTEMTAIAGRSSWICSIAATLFSIVMCLFVLYIGRCFHGKNIFAIIEETLGKWVGWSVSLLYIVLMALSSATNLSLFAAMINSYILIQTPKWVPILLLLVVCALISGSGIEVIARMAIIFSMVIIINYQAANTLAVVTAFDYKLLLPQFEKPFITYIQGTYLILGTMIETIFFVTVGIENVSMNSKPYKAIIKGVLIASFFVVTVPVSFIGILGLTEAIRTGYVAVNMFHGIQVGRFIQGMEVLVMITYFAAAAGKVSVNLFIMNTAISHIIRKFHSRWEAAFTAVLVFLVFLKYISFNKAYLLAIQLAEYGTLPFAIFILLISSICLAVGKRKGFKGKI